MQRGCSWDELTERLQLTMLHPGSLQGFPQVEREVKWESFIPQAFLTVSLTLSDGEQKETIHRQLDQSRGTGCKALVGIMVFVSSTVTS